MEEGIIVEVQTDKDEYTPYESVRMTLKIWNSGTMPVELVFASAQRYDFIILKDSEEAWRWSKDKTFAMVLGSLSLKPMKNEFIPRLGRHQEPPLGSIR
jgi:hypothetical protein